MRISLPRQQNIGVGEEFRGDVGMQVQGGHDRHRIPHQFSHGMNKIPFQVRGVLRRPRPVQAEQNAVEFIGVCEERKEFPFQFFVRSSFNHAARASARI